MEQNLVEYIMSEAEFLGLNDMYNEETRNVVHYFLEKNIKSIFGKTEFTINHEKNSEILIDKVVKDGSNPNKLMIDYAGEQYKIQYISNNELGALSIYGNIGSAVTKFDKNKNEYTNTVTYMVDNISYKEDQRVTCGTEKIFEYQKETSLNSKVEKYPKYMMIPAGVKKNPDIEVFKISSPESVENDKSSFLKKIIDEVKNPSLVSVKTNYGDPNILAYLDKIYEVMEQKTNELEVSKKL